MADIELVIRIPEEMYKNIDEPCNDEDLLRYIIKYGTQLPKPTERENCVSSEAVMHILTELGYGDEENGADAEYMSALCDVAKKVKSLPSVIPKPKIGKWVLGGWNNDFWVCSKCDHSVALFYEPVKDYNYCPHCGAKMIESQESEE